MVGITEQFNLLPESKKERYTVTIPEGSWTSNKDFTVEDGEKDIENFVKKWEIDEAWLFCIGTVSQSLSVFYGSVMFS